MISFAILVSSLIFCAGTAYIQSQLGFVDCPADTIQDLAAARASDMEGICGTVFLGMEPEMVRDHLLKPHLAPGFDCISIGCGDHCHFLRTLGIAVDEWVI